MLRTSVIPRPAVIPLSAIVGGPGVMVADANPLRLGLAIKVVAGSDIEWGPAEHLGQISALAWPSGRLTDYIPVGGFLSPDTFSGTHQGQVWVWLTAGAAVAATVVVLELVIDP